MKRSKVQVPGVRCQVDEWRGCYPSNWKGSVVAEAMTHPAKFSSRLIRRIYEHITAEGWVKAGDGVIDPFGGVGLGALDAMRLGLHWTGVELEEKFWKIGNENIALWNSRFGSMPRWGRARLVNGDSRTLLELVERKAKGSKQNIALGYGETVGQLGDMSAEKFEAAISSPPFLQSKGGTPEPKAGGVIDVAMYERHKAGNAAAHGYGKSEGQLSAMDGEGFERAVSGAKFQVSGAVSSPPYAETTVTENRQFKSRFAPERPEASDLRNKGGEAYGETEGQLGMESVDDFWLAARGIVEQVYLALEPGGHACWVVKDYVKNKQVVPFTDQWRKLCEAVGFETVHEHRAMLVHHKGRQGMLDGGVHEVKTESKSFFRRLAEKKGSPRIDWEVVWCMVKR